MEVSMARQEEIEELFQDAQYAVVMQDYEDAIAILNEVWDRTDRQDVRARVLSMRGAVHARTNDLLAARADLEQAVKANPLIPEAWGNLAFALDRLGEYQLAMDAHERGLEILSRELGPTHPRVLKKIGDRAYARIGLGELDSAEQDLRQAVAGFEATQREPLWHAWAWNNLGYFVLRSRKNASEALACFDRRDELRDRASVVLGGRTIRDGFPPDVEAVFAKNRAQALETLGRQKEADALREHAARLAESAPNARRKTSY